MNESFLGRGLDAIAGLVSGGKLGIKINPEFQEWENKTRQEGVPPSKYDAGTLIVIDDKGKRIIPKYSLTRQD